MTIEKLQESAAPRLGVGSRHERPRLAVIIPCYNEIEVIDQTYGRLAEVLGGRDDLTLRLLFVDDGSRDGTLERLREIAAKDRRVAVVALSRNFGHQPAVSAGLDRADADCVAIMDADLQDPPEVVLKMLERWRAGADVVYGIRRQRKEDPFRRFGYHGFYRLMQWAAEIDVPLDSGDFCLMDRRIVEILKGLPERGRFLRGLRAWSGFRQEGLDYPREARAAGTTKYSLAKLMKLALDGIFDFSTKPLSLMFAIGMTIATISFLLILVYILAFLFDLSFLRASGETFTGFTTVILAILFFGGVQLAASGVLGEYIGRIYRETKRRPTYVVAEVVENAEEGD